MRVVTVDDLTRMLAKVGLQRFIALTIEAIEADLKRWHELTKSPRHATHCAVGVIELMPCANEHYYAFKYVNGHPGNPRVGKLSVVGLGVLADVQTGYPLLFSEMTLLTAIRTAATAALAARYMARPNSECLGMVGTGAQAEFVTHAMSELFSVKQVNYFDTDGAAMVKYARNMKGHIATLQSCHSVDDALESADIVITATAAKKHAGLIRPAHLKPGMHLHAMGGDCPGKTELGTGVLEKCTVVVEYLEQSLEEGEVQHSSPDTVYAELWELACGLKKARKSDNEITLFDSVGFALEDFSTLKLVHQLCLEMEIGTVLPMIPQPGDPKNLYGLLSSG